MSDGSWCMAESKIDQKTPMPLNLAPLQTVRLDVSVALPLPAVPEGDSCRNTHETYALYRDCFLAQPLQVKVTLKTLGEKQFADVLRSTSPVGVAQPMLRKVA